MKNIFKKLTFVNNFYLLIIIIIITSNAYLLVNNSYNEFDTYSKELKAQELNSQKRFLKQRVDTVVKFVNFQVKNFHGKNIEDLKKSLKSYLRDIRWGKDGYLFIYDEKGTCVLLPVKPSLEGKNLINLKDPNGIYQIRELIKTSKKQNTSFVKYSWYQPSVNKISKKLGYGVYLSKLGWMIGSAIYIKNIDDLLTKKKKIIKNELENDLYKTMFFFLFSLLLIYFQTKILNNTLHRFHIFLKKAHDDLTPIDIKSLYYTEIKELAKSINYLIENIKAKKGKLENKNILLDEALKNFQSIFDFSLEGIILTSEEGRIVNLNKSAISLLGYQDFDEMDEIKLMDLIFKDDRKIVAKALQKENTGAYKIRVKKKDGFVFLVLVRGKYIYQNNKRIRISTFLDLTPFEEMQKAKESSKAKSIFLSNMSHEIRTPLNAIVGFIDILKEEEKDKGKLKYLDIISKSSEHLLEIISDILDFSKIESENMKLDMKDFFIRKELENTIELFKAKAIEKKIRYSSKFKNNLPKVIHSDLIRLKQIISNLISNAIKFTSQNGCISITIDYKNGLMQVSVKDDGTGIAQDKIGHIFKAFAQEDDSTTRKYGGTGLGLSISHKLVELLGGELKVKSELGKGSEFFFYIPVKIGKINNISNELEDIGTDKIKGKNILLVEDNRANQMFMEIILKQMGVLVDKANDGLEAVQKYKENHDMYDFILMDENMPNLSGIEATKEIRRFEEKNNLPHIWIVALTANAIKGDREKFLKAGMDEYITKPVKKELIVKILNNLLSLEIPSNQKEEES